MSLSILYACACAGLDRRWTITPVGGIDRMDTVVRLFKGQQLNICALIDASSNKLSKVEKLVRDGHLEPDQIIKLDEVIDAPAADIEDVLAEDLYLRLVQGVGGEDGQRAFYALVQADRLPPAEEEPRGSPGASTSCWPPTTSCGWITCRWRCTSNATRPSFWPTSTRPPSAVPRRSSSG